MKIRPLGAELFNAHGWADRMTRLRVAFRTFAKQPNKCIDSQVSAVRCDTEKWGLPTFGKPSPRTGPWARKGYQSWEEENLRNSEQRILLVSNVLIKCLISLIHNWDVPGSNFGPEAHYCFLVSLSLIPSKQISQHHYLPRGAMTQTIRGRRLTLERWVQSQASPFRICGGQVFSVSTSVFACQYHSTKVLLTYLNCPQSILYIFSN